MDHAAYNGNEWTEKFFAFIGIAWLVGALFFATLVIMGGNKVGTPGGPAAAAAPSESATEAAAPTDAAAEVTDAPAATAQ